MLGRKKEKKKEKREGESSRTIDIRSMISRDRCNFFFFCFFLDRFHFSLSIFFLFFFFFVFQLSNRLNIRGDGFSPDFLAKMFSKFFSTRNVEGDETLTMKPRSSKANVERFE